jgi:hypothetical protein
MSSDGTSASRKREGVDQYNSRSLPSPPTWRTTATITNELDYAISLGLRDRQQQQCSSRLSGAAASDQRYRTNSRWGDTGDRLFAIGETTTNNITSFDGVGGGTGTNITTSDRLAEVSRLRQEIAIQEQLLHEVTTIREQRFRRLQQLMDVPRPAAAADPYYVRGRIGNSTSNPTTTTTSLRDHHADLVDDILRLERELELSRMGHQIEEQMLQRSSSSSSTAALMGAGSGPLSLASMERFNHMARPREVDWALQRLISLREDDPRQRLVDELRLQQASSSGHHLNQLSGLSALFPSRSDPVLPSRAATTNLADSSQLLQGRGASDLILSRGTSLNMSNDKIQSNHHLHTNIDPSLPRSEKPVQSGPSVPVEESKVVGMALSTDRTSLSQYQATIRDALEFFTASHDDALSVVQGRKKRIRLYQVGIRCKYCAKLPLKDRSTGAVYFPASLGSVYQAAQNVASVHMLAERKTKTGACPLIPKDFQKKLEDSKNVKAGSLVGKKYWADSCKELGIAEEDGGLWFPKSLNSYLPTQQTQPAVVDVVQPESSERQSREDTMKDDRETEKGDDEEEDSQQDDDYDEDGDEDDEEEDDEEDDE